MANSSTLATGSADLTVCDREPIHIPGSIQPHGLLLVADADTHDIVAGAGALEEWFGDDWLGRSLPDLLEQDIVELLGNLVSGPGGTVIGRPLTLANTVFDVAFHRSGAHLLAELEPAAEAPMTSAASFAMLDTIAAGLERAPDLQRLCERAAAAFRGLIGYDRVMIYRFLDDDAGSVIAEDRGSAVATFMNHRFPASDIPQQARALYVRNRARVIADVGYAPAPLRPAGFAQVDLSDVALRSVSPIHIEYLHNMGVAASASFSIVKDGVLWGLVACHHHTPRGIPRDLRAAAAALAGGLARQIRAREEASSYRERVRLRTAEDAVLTRVVNDRPLRRAIEHVGDDLRLLFDGDGLAYVDGRQIDTYGACPPRLDIADIARWVETRESTEPFATHHLSSVWPDAATMTDTASGLLAIPLLGREGVLLWFRAEQVEEVEWAGNPHKAVEFDPNARLTPRTSFETWRQAVHGRSRRWSLEEVETAHRMRRAIADIAAARHVRDANAKLQQAVEEKDALLVQKDILMREVDHRVQNSLQLVAAFLSLQARQSGPGEVADQLNEARSRLSAVALVHRRLYRDDQIETIDLSRYLDDLAGDLKTSLGPEWAKAMRLDLAPVLVPTDRAINIGLVMTELVINATKYAYGGAAGPIAIHLEQHRNRFRLIVADEGGGKSGDGHGFGGRMMGAVMARLSGTLDYEDNRPGLRAILVAPIEEKPR